MQFSLFRLRFKRGSLTGYVMDEVLRGFKSETNEKIGFSFFPLFLCPLLLARVLSIFLVVFLFFPVFSFLFSEEWKVILFTCTRTWKDMRWCDNWKRERGHFLLCRFIFCEGRDIIINIWFVVLCCCCIYTCFGRICGHWNWTKMKKNEFARKIFFYFFLYVPMDVWARLGNYF